jgi:hypothetical protein
MKNEPSLRVSGSFGSSTIPLRLRIAITASRTPRRSSVAMPRSSTYFCSSGYLIVAVPSMRSRNVTDSTT